MSARSQSMGDFRDQKELLSFPLKETEEIERAGSISFPRKSWWDKSFSRMEDGSLRGSILTLLAATIGSGILMLPYTCKMTGLAVSLALITAGMAFSFWSFHLLIDVAEHFCTTRYLVICEEAGGRSIGTLYQIAIFIQQSGIILGYQIIGGSIIANTVIDLGIPKDSWLINNQWFDMAKVIIPTILIYFPLCRKMTMTSLRYGSLLAIGVLASAVLVIAVQSFFIVTKETWGKIVWIKLDHQFFQACAITFFTYACQPSFFPVYNDLSNATYRRISKVVLRTNLFQYTMYIVVAFTGYISALNDTQPIVINNPAANSVFEFLLTLSRAAVYVKLAVGIPVNYNSLRRTVYDFLYGKMEELSEPRNTMVTAGILGISTLFAIIFPKIVSVLSLLGGISSVLVAYFLPCYCYLMTFGSKLSAQWKAVHIAIAVSASAAGLSSVVVTIITIIKGTAT